MKFKKLKNANKREILESRNNAIMIALAFICALLTWYFVKVKFYDLNTKEFDNVEISTDAGDTNTGENDLKIINQLGTVKVTLNCSSKDSTRIGKNDIIPYVDIENLKHAGEYNLAVKVKFLKNIEIPSYTVTPSIVTVELDKLTEKVVNLTADAPNIKAADGKTIGDKVCTPAQLSISGPSRIVDTISRVEAVSESSKILDSTEIIYSDGFSCYTEDDLPINLPQNSNVTFSSKTVAITVSVLTQKTVPIVASFETTDPNFDKSSLDYTFTPGEITLASDSGETINDTFGVKISLRDLVDENGIVYEKDYNVKTNLINKSGFDKVHFKLNNTNLGVRELTLSNSNLHPMQVPSDDYDYTISTEKITIKLIGPRTLINDITASDLNADINLSNVESETLMVFPIDVDLSLKDEKYSTVWAVTDQKVNIKKTPKSESTTQAPNRNVTS